MRRKLVVVLFGLHAAAAFAGAEAGGEFVANGEMNGGIENWSGKRVVIDSDGGRSIVDAPEFVAFEPGDGVGGEKGCLRIQFSDVNEKCTPWKSGAYLALDDNIPPHTEVIIRFQAKSVDGSRRLSVHRPAGGFYTEPVFITEQWNAYQLRFESKHNTPGFFFVITDHYGRRGYLEPGTFLLDEISVKVSE